MTNISRDNINGLLANAETDGIRKAIAKLTSTMNSNVNHARLHNVNGASDHTGVSGAAENHLVAFDANGLFKDSGLTTSTSHNRDHGIDDVLDHNGVSGATTDNLIKFNSNGLPADSGKAYTLVHTQHTDTGTTSTTFVVNSGSGTAKVTIDPTSYSSPYTINKTKTDAWDAGGHTQNTDTGTTSNTFVVNSDGGEAKVTIDPTGYSTAYTINKAKTDAWDSAGHTQNTDTGTTSNTFIINSDGGEAKLTLDPTGYSTAYTINKAKTDTWDSAGHTQNTDTGTSAGTFTINDLSVNETISTPAATNLVLDPGTTGYINLVQGGATYSVLLNGTNSVASGSAMYINGAFSGGGNLSYLMLNNEMTAATTSVTDLNIYDTVTTYAATTRYGIYLHDPSGTGTITTNYGIYLESQTKGGTNYDIYFTAAGSISCGTGTMLLQTLANNSDISLTPHGTGEVNISKVDINAGTIDGATIATSDITVGAGKTLNVSAGTFTLADNQISGNKVEGGTIAAITISALTCPSIVTVGDGALVIDTGGTGAVQIQGSANTATANLELLGTASGASAYGIWDHMLYSGGASLGSFNSSPTVTATADSLNNFFAVATISAATTTRHGLYINNATGASSLTNQYGIYISSLTKGSSINDAICLASGGRVTTTSNGNIALTPNGTGEVDISKVDIDAGTIDGATIATSDITVGAGKTLDVSAGTLTLAADQISGDKVEGGTINAITINTATVGNTGLVVGTSTPFSDSTGALTLQNVDALDATTEGTIESAIDTLANLTSIGSSTGLIKVTTGTLSYITDNSSGWDAAASASHTQNTDTGTTSNTFIVNSDGGEAKLTLDPTSYVTAYTINKAKTDAWDSAGHTQNTDTGTTSNTFVVNSDGGEAKLTLDPTSYTSAYTINKTKTDAWDAASGGGANVTLSNLTDGAVVCNTTLKSDTTNTDDIGSTDIRWKDGYFAGALYIASMGGNWTNAGRTVADGGAFTTIDINGGTVDSITSLTVANDVDIGSFGLRASSLTADGLTSGRLTTISTNGLLTSATVTESSGALGGITTLSMSGVLTNTKTDGTAPFTITSTTKVSNLNVDRVDDTHIGTLTNTRLIRYNSTGTTLENATVTESSGALASITTISMSNQLTSSLATGTMPLNVTSTTKCTNLNVDYLDGYHAATLTNGTLLRYNSTGTQIESGTVTESSGALGGITTLSMSGDLTMTGATVNLTHSGATSLTITSTSGTVAVEGVIHNSNTITAANATNIIIDPATTGYINLVQGGATNSVVLDGTNSVASGIGLYVNGTFSGGTSPAAISLNNTVSASATNFYDLKIATVESSGTITSRYGVYLGNPTGAGAVTNCYGLYIESQAKGGTLNYDLYFSATGNISAATGVLTLQTLANNSNINLTTQGTGKVVTNIGINPDADDGAYLGQAGTAWSDLFLATGGVINWNSGNVTLTHAAGVLTLSAGTQFKVDHISESTGSHSIVLDTNWTAASRTCADLGTVTTGIFTSLTGGSIVSASNGTITMQPNGTGQSLIYALSRPYTYYSSGPQTLTIALAGLIVCDGTFTVNLPDATTVDANTSIGYIIKNINTGTITIDPNGSQTIDGSATSVTLDAQWETIALVSYNGNWLKMTSN